jgi:hypothetical protein
MQQAFRTGLMFNIVQATSAIWRCTASPKGATPGPRELADRLSSSAACISGKPSTALTRVSPSSPGPLPLPPVPEQSTLTARFMASGGREACLDDRRSLGRKTAVMVRGFMAELYLAAGNKYFDDYADVCHSLAMRVVLANVGHIFNAEHNARILFEQLSQITGPDDSLILFAHSNGAQATLLLLTDPAYSAVGRRVHGWFPVNGVFHGSPVATMFGPMLGAAIGGCMRVMGGDSDTVAAMSVERREACLRERMDDIQALSRRMPVIPVVSSFRGPRSPLDFGRIIMWAPNLYMRWRLGLENDGAVPLANQFLPGHDAITLYDMSHGDTVDQCGPWDLRDLARRLLVLFMEDLPEELRDRGRIHDSDTVQPAFNDYDFVTRLLRSFNLTHGKLMLEHGPMTDYQRASKLVSQARRGYTVAVLTGAFGVVTLPVVLTGLPLALLGVSAATANYSNVTLGLSAWYAARGLVRKHL